MGMLENKLKDKAAGSVAKQPRDRFILGTSECYFEAAAYMTGLLDPAKVKALFVNEASSVAETEGKSLKVMFNTGNEIKFIGFVTAGDASLELDDEDIATVIQHATTEDITVAIDANKLADLF